MNNFSEYLTESLSGSSGASVDAGGADTGAFFLQISSTCNGRCIFCSENNNPWEARRTKFRPLDEVERMCFSLKQPFTAPIEISRTHPGRISEGEPLIHPDFLQVIKTIRRYLPGNYIYIDTNGSLLTKDLLQELNACGNIVIRLSLPTLNERIFHETYQTLKSEHYRNVRYCIDEGARFEGIEFRPTTVAMPSWYGYEELDRTVEYLAAAGFKLYQLYSPGWTRYTPEDVARLLHYKPEEMQEFVDYATRHYQIIVEWGLSPRLPVVIPGMRDILKDLCKQSAKQVVVLTSTLAFKRASAFVHASASGLPLDLRVISVHNKVYGGNIGSAGLWFVSDVEAVLQRVNRTTVIMPRLFIDRYGYDLMGNDFIDYVNESSNRFILL